MSDDGIKIGNYILKQTIGKGTFGKVKLGEHKIGKQTVAVKIISRRSLTSRDMSLKMRREISILKLFNHPNIVRLYEVVGTEKNIFLIMEYVSGGDLYKFINENGRQTESSARRFFQQIIGGVEYCHIHQVVHRDLKPENIMLDNFNNVKLVDFGLSNIMNDGDFLQTSCGSPNYAAPEIISGVLYTGTPVDIWSCGVILYVLLCARLPFDEKTIEALFNKIKAGDYSFPNSVPLSDEVKDLISKMLVVDPASRITIPEIRHHPWFLKDLPSYLSLSGINQSYLLSSKTKGKSSSNQLQITDEEVEEILDEISQKLMHSKEECRRDLIREKILKEKPEKVDSSSSSESSSESSSSESSSESSFSDSLSETSEVRFTSPIVVLFALMSDQKRNKKMEKKIKKNLKEDNNNNTPCVEKSSSEKQVWSLEIESFAKRGEEKKEKDEDEEGKEEEEERKTNSSSPPLTVTQSYPEISTIEKEMADIFVEEEDDYVILEKRDVSKGLFKKLSFSPASASTTTTTNNNELTSPLFSLKQEDHYSWHLGIKCDKTPSKIMESVYLLLKKYGYEWKNQTSIHPTHTTTKKSSGYSLVCRLKENNKIMKRKDLNGGVLVHPVEISIDLYNIQSGEEKDKGVLSPSHKKSGGYCLDFKRVKGDGMTFMAISSMLASKLNVYLDEL